MAQEFHSARQLLFTKAVFSSSWFLISYLQSVSKLLSNYVSFVEFYQQRAEELKDILTQTQLQQKRAVDLGLSTPAAASAGWFGDISLLPLFLGCF
jgi:predicted XRE-type DNA-binding protein